MSGPSSYSNFVENKSSSTSAIPEPEFTLSIDCDLTNDFGPNDIDWRKSRLRQNLFHLELDVIDDDSTVPLYIANPAWALSKRWAIASMRLVTAAMLALAF
jgi:hypothetical protein